MERGISKGTGRFEDEALGMLRISTLGAMLIDSAGTACRRRLCVTEIERGPSDSATICVATPFVTGGRRAALAVVARDVLFVTGGAAGKWFRWWIMKEFFHGVEKLHPANLHWNSEARCTRLCTLTLPLKLVR